MQVIDDRPEATERYPYQYWRHFSLFGNAVTQPGDKLTVAGQRREMAKHVVHDGVRRGCWQRFSQLREESWSLQKAASSDHRQS